MCMCIYIYIYIYILCVLCIGGSCQLLSTCHSVLSGSGTSGFRGSGFEAQGFSRRAPGIVFNLVALDCPDVESNSPGSKTNKLYPVVCVYVYIYIYIYIHIMICVYLLISRQQTTLYSFGESGRGVRSSHVQISASVTYSL